MKITKICGYAKKMFDIRTPFVKTKLDSLQTSSQKKIPQSIKHLLKREKHKTISKFKKIKINFPHYYILLKC